MKTLIKEIKTSVEETKGFWTRLPYGMCQDEGVGNNGGGSSRSSRRRSRQRGHNAEANERQQNHYNNGSGGYAQSRCWNGRDAGKYMNAVVSDGLANQEANPEVSVDISQPDIYINEQIFALKLMTKKLESAYNGQPVMWASKSTYFIVWASTVHTNMLTIQLRIFRFPVFQSPAILRQRH